MERKGRCMEMMRGNVLVSYGLITGIICCESASGILGMSNYSDTYISFLAEGISRIINSKCMRVIPVASADEVETQMVGNRIVTTPYRTIIDLITYDCDVEIVCESLMWWKDKYGTLDKIEQGLKEARLYEKYAEEYYPAYNDQSYSQFSR